MNFRNISAWSIRNPVVPIVLFIGLTIAGIMAFATMQVNDNPDIDFPGVNVGISQPGAAPTEIETQITQRVEAAVRGINGVDEIQSGASEGYSNTFVQFAIGTDANDAVNEVKNAVDQIRSDLPEGILEPQVSKVDIGGNGPIGYWAVQASDMTMEQLSWFVDDTVAKRLLGIAGMASVERAGGVDREIRVVLDPGRMQALGVTAAQVNGALRQVNLNAAGGRSEIAGSRQSVRVLGNADTAFALGESQVQLGNGRSVKLTDVADVSDSYGEQSSIGKIAGKQVVTFSIERAKGASDVTVYDEAVKQLEKMQKENPGVTFTRLYSSVDYTRDQYHSSLEAMLEGAALAVLIVWLFLRDWRATAISAIAIPLSAIPTFWFMDLMGFTLNGLSLLALSLVAGVLVDDAIVEIENIVRHMRMGKSAYQASIDAADEIGLAVVATTFSIVAVFLPVGLMPGISGQFFKNFGLTIVAAVLVSLAVARMITPMIAAYFLKAHGEATHGEGRLMDVYMRVLRWFLDPGSSQRRSERLVRVAGHARYYALGYLMAVVGFVGTLMKPGEPGADPVSMASKIVPALFTAGFAFVVLSLLTLVVGRIVAAIRQPGDDGFLARCVYVSGKIWARLFDHRTWAFGLGILALVITGYLLVSIPQQFQPTTNSDSSQVNIETVPGTTIQQTEVIADRVAAIIQAEAEVDRVLERVREGNARLFVTLKTDRKTTSIDFERRTTPKLQQVADARVSFQSQSGGFGTGRDISVMLTGSDPVLLDAAAAKITEEMKSLKEVVAPRIAADLRRPELIVQPRLDLAAQLGVTTAALSQAIRIATLGEIDQNSAKFSLSDRQIPIRVMLPESSRRDIGTIQNLPVPTASGGSVPLSRVANITFGSGPTTVQRYNQARRVFVGADLAKDVVKGTAMEKINALPTMKNLPRGVSNTAAGDEKWQAELIMNFIIAVISGVLLVFAVLVLLYRRFISPLVNMTSLLLAPLGGLLALKIAGQPISLPVYIGLLMLLGIVAKNSILLVDFAIEEMSQGHKKFDAIMDAGHKRAQPIVMTTVAMVAGMVPTALSLSGDGAWRAPMGTVVIGGLIVSTLLTLVIVPAGFSLADGLEKRVGPWLSGKLLSYTPSDRTSDSSDPDHNPQLQPAE